MGKSKRKNNFPDIYQLPNLNQYQISSLSKPISPSETEVVIKILLNKKEAQARCC